MGVAALASACVAVLCKDVLAGSVSAAVVGGVAGGAAGGIMASIVFRGKR
jgi:hypothetical protein